MWFWKKILSSYSFSSFLILAGLLFVFLSVIFTFHKPNFVLAITLITVGIVCFSSGISIIKNIKKRAFGISLEKEAYRFLRKNTVYEMEFRKNIKDGGDIDIYVKDLKVAIDVKAYKKIDNRIFSDKNIKSYLRQSKIAKKVVVWLPLCKSKKIIHKENFDIVTGKETILNYLKEIYYLH